MKPELLQKIVAGLMAVLVLLAGWGLREIYTMRVLLENKADEDDLTELRLTVAVNEKLIEGILAKGVKP